MEPEELLMSIEVKDRVSEWETKRTAETRRIGDRLREAGSEQVDAYCFNPASIRLRFIDPRLRREEGIGATGTGLPGE